MQLTLQSSILIFITLLTQTSFSKAWELAPGISLNRSLGFVQYEGKKYHFNLEKIVKYSLVKVDAPEDPLSGYKYACQVETTRAKDLPNNGPGKMVLIRTVRQFTVNAIGYANCFLKGYSINDLPEPDEYHHTVLSFVESSEDLRVQYTRFAEESLPQLSLKEWLIVDLSENKILSAYMKENAIQTVRDVWVK